ncbi:EAL domain-containing protein [Exiguobacterium algae]|uniref:bifunctional diguanylate cyclase/phosphodiesterase n=1 Tax=Exiguobacterium algae TaxID=2751250 RepID=UPI001F0A8836|nr:EAL domain-containing protein [Exiguobacterium algae]
MDPITEPSMSQNLLLMALSFLIASVSAFAAIELAQRVNGQAQTSNRIWIVSGGATLGLGIWSMHFIAMLGHDAMRDITYSIFLIFLSIVVAMAGCILAFWMISHQPTPRRFIQSGAIMGGGIGGMHYIGMASIQGVVITYHAGLVLLSVMIAFTVSFVALWVGFFSTYTKRHIPFELKLLFSLMMGVAIFAMHQVGMRAASFTFLPDSTSKLTAIEPTLLAWLVSAMTVLLFSIYFISMTMDRQIRKRDLFQTAILESTDDAIVTTSKDGEVHYANTAFSRLFGNVEAESFFQDYHPSFTVHQPFHTPMKVEFEDKMIEVTCYPLVGETTDQVLWFLRDVTETMSSQRLIEHMAFHDSLTDLPNRHKLEMLLQEQIGQEKPVACLYIDLNRWGFMHGILGHHGADDLIVQVAKRLKQTIHPDDVLTRIGSSEFVILLRDQRSTLAKQKAEKCIKAISRPFDVDGTSIELSMSAGISHYPTDTCSPDELVQFARLATHVSMRAGKNQIKTFEEESRHHILRSVEIEKALAMAITRNEFSLVYQPKINLTKNRLEGVEALLRWDHPELGRIAPSDFIPITEQTGLIHPIGSWVLREACLAWVRWNRSGLQPFVLSVNVSPLQFAREDFVENLQTILMETRMDPMYLELEVTESSMLSYESSTREKLTQIHQLGILISLDDFGTGYSSFSQLRELPVQVLKIDRSFITNLFTDRNQEAIVRSMIQLGHNLGMKVLMEGVEHSNQLEWLLQENCDYVQGYYFSRPLQEQDVLKHVKQVKTYLEFEKIEH